MLSRAMVLGLLLASASGWAQTPPPEFDASIPDASVGLGGAEMGQEADDGRSNTVCAQSRDCERGFACNNGRCTWTGFRLATQTGCAVTGGPLVFGLLVLARWLRRRPGN